MAQKLYGIQVISGLHENVKIIAKKYCIELIDPLKHPYIANVYGPLFRALGHTALLVIPQAGQGPGDNGTGARKINFCRQD